MVRKVGCCISPRPLDRVQRIHSSRLLGRLWAGDLATTADGARVSDGEGTEYVEACYDTRYVAGAIRNGPL